MIGWEAILYTFVCGSMLAMSALGLESAITTPDLDRREKRFFAALFASLAICSASFFLELIAYERAGLIALQVVAYYIQSLSASVAFPMLAVYLLYCCEEGWKGSALGIAAIALWGTFVVLLTASQFTTVFWHIGQDGQLHFGPAYSLLVVPLFVMLLLILAGVVRRRNKLSRSRYRAFLLFLVPVTIAMIVHTLIVPAFTLIDFCLTLSAYAAYRMIVTESIEQSLRRQRELAAQRASIAVLQMRPHFIYNTMTSIYYLCDQDPQLAKQVTMDFTAYLRKNLAAISREGVIPFSEELEHTRAYLAVEQAQFEDDLLVDYDTAYTMFSVPPLTLQPIVENAVKHGMDPDSGPLHILVRTRETDSGSEVIVEDDGPGFDPAIADDPHTTLANIRQRLEMMCGGQLDISPRAGGGTVVKVTVQ